MGERTITGRAMFDREQPPKSSNRVDAIPMPEVAEALNDLFKQVDCYEELLSRLGNKLHAIVLPAEPVCTDGIAADRFYCTSLATSINEARWRLRNVADGMNDLCDRIQL